MTEKQRIGLSIEERAFLAAYNALSLAKQSYEKAFRNAHPRGQRVHWMHGLYIQVGEVVMHGTGDRLKARNVHTGREVWVDAWKIRECCV